MNFGTFLLDIAQALIKLGSQAVSFATAKIDISSFLKVLNALKINIDLPSQISVLGLVGSIGGLTILTFFLIKLIRG